MAASVWFCSLTETAENEDLPILGRKLEPELKRLAGKLGLQPNAAGGSWLLKIQLGAPYQPAAVPAAWAAAVAEGLGLSERAAVCDTLSIQLAGLADLDDHLASARRKGFESAGGFPYRVADDPRWGPSAAVKARDGSGTEMSVCALAAAAEGICVLNQVRPHPYLGLRGALAALGLELVDRSTKLRLHERLQPRVDTPLCAGCGSCLNVCIWDAIRIEAGRAVIDRERCTGCGECLNACFLAGLRPEQADAVPDFQIAAAEAARAVAAGKQGRLGFFNFLIRQDRRNPGEARAGRLRLGDVGVLASRDPVALDRATWDLVSERVGGSLQSWSGFSPDPSLLLAKAEEIGLGVNSYILKTLI